MKVWQDPYRTIETLGHVGWGDNQRFLVANRKPGIGVDCKYRFGIRRAIWDAAFGYVNGFRKRDILFYCVTRSLSKRVMNYALNRNERLGRYSVFHSLPLDMRQHCLDTGKTY